jgi:hypothetical protein
LKQQSRAFIKFKGRCRAVGVVVRLQIRPARVCMLA